MRPNITVLEVAKSGTNATLRLWSCSELGLDSAEHAPWTVCGTSHITHTLMVARVAQATGTGLRSHSHIGLSSLSSCAFTILDPVGELKIKNE